MNLDGPVDANGSPLLPYVAGSPTYVAGTGGFGINTAAELQLRNLNLAAGNSVAVKFKVTTPCTGSNLAWTIAAKQSNTFNGSGNDFQQPPPITSGIASGGCNLAWVTQPASAALGTPITGAPFDTLLAGPRVAVAAVPAGCTTVSASCPVITSVNSGSVTLNEVAGSTGNTTDFSGTNATFVNGYATFDGSAAGNANLLEGNSAGTGFQLQGASPGFTSTPYSDPFVIGNGEACTGTGCPTFNTTIDSSTSVDSSATGSGFAFLAINNATIPSQVISTSSGAIANYGCAGFVSVGAGAFQETDGRLGSTNQGTLNFTYYVSKTQIQKRFGANSGQPVIPICAGVQKLDSSGVPISCNNGSTGGWTSFQIDPTYGTFTGALTTAVCYGNYWWGILGTSNQTPSVDPTVNPAITGWGSSSNYRYFNIQVPSPWDYKGGG